MPGEIKLPQLKHKALLFLPAPLALFHLGSVMPTLLSCQYMWCMCCMRCTYDVCAVHMMCCMSCVSYVWRKCCISCISCISYEYHVCAVCPCTRSMCSSQLRAVYDLCTYDIVCTARAVYVVCDVCAVCTVPGIAVVRTHVWFVFTKTPSTPQRTKHSTYERSRRQRYTVKTYRVPTANNSNGTLTLP